MFGNACLAPSFRRLNGINFKTDHSSQHILAESVNIFCLVSKLILPQAAPRVAQETGTGRSGPKSLRILRPRVIFFSCADKPVISTMTLASQLRQRSVPQFCWAHWPSLDIMHSMQSRDRKHFNHFVRCRIVADTDLYGLLMQMRMFWLGSGLITRISWLQRERWPIGIPLDIDHNGLLPASSLSNGQT